MIHQKVMLGNKFITIIIYDRIFINLKKINLMKFKFKEKKKINN